MKFLSQINVNTEYTLPIVDGNNGQVLTTDGQGAVYWGSVSAGATSLDGLTDVEITSPQAGQILNYSVPLGGTVPVWRNITSPYATIASPAFTGIPTAPTAPTGTDSTQIATTAFVKAQGYLSSASSINDLSDVTISTATTGQILQWSGTQWVNATLSTVEYVSKVQHLVKCGVAVTKGQAVYVTTSDGTNMIVGLASNATEPTSSKVIGLAASTGAINDQIFVVTEGLIAGLNTSTANAGDPVWLGTGGNLIFGLLNKPVAPAHLVYLGVVTRVQQNNGEIFVNVQNGFELHELHDVLISSPSAGQLIRRDSDGLWKNWSPNFLTAEADTLQTVTTRGASTNLAISANGVTSPNFTSTALMIINADSSGSLLPDQGSPANKILSFRWQANEYGYIDTDGKVTLNGFKTPTGTASQFLKANGTVDSSTYLTTTSAASLYTTYDYVDAEISSVNTYVDNNFVPKTRTLTINGTSFDLSANRSWTISTAETDTLATVTTRGNTTNSGIRVNGRLTVGGDPSTFVYGTLEYVDATTGFSISAPGRNMVIETGWNENLWLKTGSAGLTVSTNNGAGTNTTRLYVTPSTAYFNVTGNVGIGRSNPSYKLDVAGNARFDNELYVGGVWSSSYGPRDSNGNINFVDWNSNTIARINRLSGIASVGNRKLSMGILDINSSGSPEVRINTKIPFALGGADFTVNIKGFQYGSANMVSLSIGWHYYLSQFYQETAISNGAFSPTITLGVDENNYVVIHLSNVGYWPKMYVESVYSSNYADDYVANWNWVDAGVDGLSNTTTVPYKPLDTSITGNAAYATNAGNSATTSQTNFSTLTVSNNTVATQAWVTSQGYATSFSETDTLATVTARGASTNTFTSLLGGSKLVIQNANNGGSGRGIFMWSSDDSNWGIYMSTAAAGVSLAGGNAVASIDGRTSHHIRFRVYYASGNGFIWENNSEVALMSLTGDTGNLYTRGQIYAGNSTSNVVWHAGNDGASSGLDADLLDGIDSARFIYGQSGNRRGTNLISNWNQTDFPDVAFLSAENGGTNAPTGDYTYGTQYSFHRDGAAYRTQLVTALYSDTSIYVRNSRDSDVWNSWKRLWHSGDFSSTNVSNWNAAYNDRITAVAVSGTGTKTLTLTQQDGGTLTATWTDYDTDNDAQTLSWDQGQTLLSISGGNDITLTGLATEDYVNSQGFVTSSGTVAGVVRTVTGTNSAELVRGNMGDNDQARILVGATASNAGYLEIATADDGTEPIYVRQYTGTFTTEARTATLLDGSGNTTFPGTVTAGRYRGHNSIVLNNYTTVNPSSNVFLYSQPNDRDAWIFLDSADTGSNWGIYHRQIDSAVGDIPANSIGFVGGGSSTLQAYISLANGDAYFRGNLTIGGTFTENSSIRFKENIQPLEPALAKVEQLNPVTYTKITSQEEEIGLIAEEVAELFPEVVTYNEAGQPQGIQYQRLSVILLKAVQELTERVNKLENK